MAFILKKEIQAFAVVDGPFAGCNFMPGKEYSRIPPQEAHKFEEIKAAQPSADVTKGAASSAGLIKKLAKKDAVKLTTQATPKGYAGLKKEGTNEIIPSDTQPAGGLSQ